MTEPSDEVFEIHHECHLLALEISAWLEEHQVDKNLGVTALLMLVAQQTSYHTDDAAGERMTAFTCHVANENTGLSLANKGL